MKKIISLLLIILTINLMVGTLFAGDRMVIVERFTSSTCGPCGTNNPIMDAWFSSQDPDRVTGIAYHMNWPAPGWDPMFALNPTDNMGRRTFYGVNSIPQAFMDGVINIQPNYSSGALTGYFNSRKDSLSPVNIIVKDSTWGTDSALVKAIIFCEMPLANPNVTVQMCVIERLVTNISPPPTNGESQFPDVMRKMLPSSNGTGITLLPGNTYTIEQRYRILPQWNAAQLKHMVFVQSGMEVLNSALKTANFTLTPNYAYRVVPQGTSQSATYKIKVPVVVSGYNSPITLTAEVNPPASGVSVSFPSGNVISNYPDSVTLQVSSTGGVPTGSYRIVITGTNTNNKVHKTQVSYLVGQNYVLTGTSREGLEYLVDNTSYTTARLFTWNLGTSHLLGAVTPQQTGNTRYVFQNWNGTDTNQTINVNVGATNSSYFANFKTQYRLIGIIQPSGIPVTFSQGNGFFDSSSTFNLSIAPLQLQWNGQTWYFQNWNGSGNGSYSGPNPNGQVTMNNIIAQTSIYDTIMPIGIHNLGNEIPKTYELNQNYPNPFNPTTKVKFAIPTSSDVKITVYDILGNEVTILANGFLNAGYYEIDWNASSYASGAYFYKMETPSWTNIKRMILVK